MSVWGRGARLAAAVALACGSVPFVGVGVAHADTVQLVPTNSAYFYNAGINKPDAAPIAPPNVTAEFLDGVAPGHLAVSSQGGTEDKVSFLYFDVFALPPEATIDKAVVTMKLVPDAPPDDLSYNASPAAVQACKSGDGGFSGDDGVGIANAPSRLCNQFKAVGKAGPAGTYQWDITGLAQTWLSGLNDGLAFTRAEELPVGNFQVVFDAAPTARLDLTYTVPSTSEPELPPLPGPVVPPADSLPPVSPDLPIDPGAPIVPQPQPNPAPQPQVSQPRVAAAPVALSTSLRPETGLWLGGLGLAVALVLVSLVLGDTGAVSTSTRRSLLSRALADRHRLAPVPAVRHRPA